MHVEMRQRGERTAERQPDLEVVDRSVLAYKLQKLISRIWEKFSDLYESPLSEDNPTHTQQLAVITVDNNNITISTQNHNQVHNRVLHSIKVFVTIIYKPSSHVDLNHFRNDTETSLVPYNRKSGY